MNLYVEFRAVPSTPSPPAESFHLVVVVRRAPDDDRAARDARKQRIWEEAEKW